MLSKISFRGILNFYLNSVPGDTYVECYLPIQMAVSFVRQLEVQNPTDQQNKPRETGYSGCLTWSVPGSPGASAKALSVPSVDSKLRKTAPRLVMPWH